MVTGEPTLESASEAVRNGACDYLFKPVSKINLLRAVSTAVKIKDLEDENRAYQENLENMVNRANPSAAKRDGECQTRLLLTPFSHSRGQRNSKTRIRSIISYA